MRAVIMAGGKGTRLQGINADIPKPMFPVLGKPILEYQIESLKSCGVRDITIIVGHLSEAIKDFLGDGSLFGVNIDYIIEDKPLGTAGALYYLKDKVADDFILLFGDLILDVDFNRFMEYHRAMKSEYGVAMTLFGHPNSHPYDSDVLVVDNNGIVSDIISKKAERKFFYHNFVNAGIYCLSADALNIIGAPEKRDLEKDIVLSLMNSGRVAAYRSTEYVKDMGTPERLEAVSRDISNDIVSKRSLKEKQRAIFLDRDGTINEHRGFLKRTEDFELLGNSAEAIRMINSSEYLCIVATNQPVIARGECTFEGLDDIHKKMETELGKAGAYLDDIFFCPHHPDRGFAGEIPELKIKCDCRKPGIGMITSAAEKYNIDVSGSWYIGDSTMDIQTGRNAGMKTILVRTGEGGADGKYDAAPDYVAEDLLEAVRIVLGC